MVPPHPDGDPRRPRGSNTDRMARGNASCGRRLLDPQELAPPLKPRKVSKSRIKCLRGLSKPQYRLRVGEIRVFTTSTATASKCWPSSPKRRQSHGSPGSEIRNEEGPA